MTSIEALNRIECATDLTKEMRWETIVSNPYGNELQTVRKDLEVLEILKKGVCLRECNAIPLTSKRQRQTTEYSGRHAY